MQTLLGGHHKEEKEMAYQLSISTGDVFNINAETLDIEGITATLNEQQNKFVTLGDIIVSKTSFNSLAKVVSDDQANIVIKTTSNKVINVVDDGTFDALIIAKKLNDPKILFVNICGTIVNTTIVSTVIPRTVAA